MSYKEYQELFQKAQKYGQYHLFIYDVVNSRKGLTIEERSKILKLIFNVYQKIEEIEQKENRSILHKSKNLLYGSLKAEVKDGIEYYKYDHTQLEKLDGRRADIEEPIYISGDLYGFTIERNTLTPEQIDKIFEEEKEKLGIMQEFHKANGYYETDKYEEGNKLYFRGYCIEQLEEISKKEKDNKIEQTDEIER